MINKKAFSMVEIIIAITILVLLTVVGISSKQGYDENLNNSKIVADIETINNALESQKQENTNLPMPGGNINFFKIDTSYSHSYEDSETFGVYGSLTEKTVSKKYVDILPLDPRTNSYYAYGKTKESNEFEIASVQIEKSVAKAKVSGNYTAEVGPYNLIREYNGADFVFDGSEDSLPYNPEELLLTATDENGNIYREGDTVLVAAGDSIELYFSDGSVSILGDVSSETRLVLTSIHFPDESNLNTFVKVGLEAGSIWTKATHLNDESEFQIYTSDSTAAVRGTIFGVSLQSDGTEVIVEEGTVEVTETPDENGQIEDYTVIEIIVSKSDTRQKKVKHKKHETRESHREGEIKGNHPTFKSNQNIRVKEDITKLNEENERLIAANEEKVELDSKVCMFNGQEIEEGETITEAYSSKNGTSPTDCDSKKGTRTCSNGNLSNDSYAFNSCTAPNECAGGITKNTYKTYIVNNRNFKKKCVDNGTEMVFETEQPLSCIVNFHDESGNCISNTKQELCTGTLPLNTEKYNNKNTFTRNYVGAAWIPTVLESWIKDDLLGSECTFKCTTGYDWNSGTSTCEINTPLTGENSLGGPWILKGYIPYNSYGDVKMYDETGINFDPLATAGYSQSIYWNCGSGGQCEMSPSDFGALSFNKDYSFAEFSSGEKGLYLERTGTVDYIKYQLSSSWTSGDFAIEMNVRFPTSNPGGTRYLYNLGNYKLYLGGTSTPYIKLRNGVYTESNPNSYFDGNFHKITAKKEGNNYSLYIDGLSVGSFTSTNSVGTTLYVGGKNSSDQNQINDIIDYVKIYTK